MSPLDTARQDSESPADVRATPRYSVEGEALDCGCSTRRRSNLFPQIGVRDSDISGMYGPVFEMKIFHSINCFVTTQGCDRLVWHNHVFDPESLQPLSPKVRAMPFTTESLGEHISTFFAPRL